MNSTESKSLWISLGFALIAGLLLYSWSQDKKTEVTKVLGATKKVVRAAENIAEMETLDESKLTLVDIPQEYAQPDVISDITVAVGQVAAAPIKKDEQVLQTKLLLPGPETGLSLEVSPGKRAITIPVDDMRGVSKLIKPGDRVDILAAVDSGKGMDSHREVRIILQDTAILATGLNIVNNLPRRIEFDVDGKKQILSRLSGNTNFTNITIEAKPDDAQILVYLLSTSPSSLFLALRNPNDKVVSPLKTTTIDDVLGKGRLLPVMNFSQPMPASVPTNIPQQNNLRPSGSFRGNLNH